MDPDKEKDAISAFVEAYLRANPHDDSRRMSEDLVKRGDGRVERLCEHGVGHPIEKLTENWDERWMGVHGCDGCCAQWSEELKERET